MIIGVIKAVLRKPYRLARTLFKVRWVKTLRINFALLSFKQAIKCPILVTGKLKIDSLKGRVVFDCPIKFGLVIIGKSRDNMPIETNSSRLLIDGTLVFKGHCLITHSANVVVWKGGKMIIGKYVAICSGVLLKCVYKVSIGDFTRLTSGCFVMDTNVHAIKDTSTGKMKRIFSPIRIGQYCWLCMNTSVLGGAKIPDYSISTRYSLIDRDFTDHGNGCLLAGMPAKVIKTNIQRIYDNVYEQKITRYFYDNPKKEYFEGELGYENPTEYSVIDEFRI